jgi:YbgC/YbaW family acyl-CoA thioester hydrolase
LISRLPIVVRSTELDTLGHVNNSVYQQWFEWGRFEWVRDAKSDWSVFEADGLTLVVVHVAIDYRREARLDDALIIETALVRLGGKSLTYRQRVVHRDGGVACEGDVVLACFDKRARKSAPLPDAARQKMSAFLEPGFPDA